MKSNTKNKTSKEFDSEELLKEYKKSLKTIRSLKDKIKDQAKQINNFNEDKKRAQDFKNDDYVMYCEVLNDQIVFENIDNIECRKNKEVREVCNYLEKKYIEKVNIEKNIYLNKKRTLNAISIGTLLFSLAFKYFASTTHLMYAGYTLIGLSFFFVLHSFISDHKIGDVEYEFISLKKYIKEKVYFPKYESSCQDLFEELTRRIEDYISFFPDERQSVINDISDIHNKIIYNKKQVQEYSLENFIRYAEDPTTQIEELENFAESKNNV